jgi:hypothetical protein
MNIFLFIFRMNLQPGAQPDTTQMKTYMAQWTQWIGDMENAGQLAPGGNHLSARGKVLYSDGRTQPTPFIEDGTSVAGYILIHAKSIDEATIIAEKCPLLNGKNTSVEIRATAAPGLANNI